MSRGSISHNYEYISGYSTVLQNINPARFILKIRQQPIQTRQSTNNERDRRPLDPPPIVQIELENSTLQESQDFLQNPYLFMSVTLIHSTTHEDMNNTTQNTLSGQTTSSMYKLKDVNNQDGGFFVFGDLSVKIEGQYRLKFSIFEIRGLTLTNLKSIYSDVFQVYSSKAFPGMLESTFLSRSFSDQGVRIRIRKEHRVQIGGSRKRKLSISQEEDERSNGYIEKSQKPPTLAMYQRPPWANSLEYVYENQQRRSSMNSIMSSTSEDYQRRPSVPFSPPHQSYDNHGNYQKANYFQRVMMPSPPLQSSLFKDNHRRLSVEAKILPRRQSADPQYNPPHLDVPRRLSLQQYKRRPSNLSEEIIHLPPLRISNRPPQQDGEVDAAVAMMELASRRKQEQQQKDSRINYFI